MVSDFESDTGVVWRLYEGLTFEHRFANRSL